jgi:hypothetical protein
MSCVIALALDAADARYVDALVAAGAMPNLARLRTRAAHIPLRADGPYRAEAPLTEFTTGRRAETIGYWSTVTFDPATYAAYMRGASTAEPFYAFGRGAPVVAFDVPKVVRSPRVDGIQVLGWGAHSPQYPVGSLPSGLLDEVIAEFGPHPALSIEYAGTWNQPEYLERLGTAQADGIRARASILRWLADRSPDWRLLVTVFGETHQPGHMMWHGAWGGLLGATSTATIARDAYREIHRAFDDALGEILRWAPEDATVIVFSVQGMSDGAEDTASALVSEVLYRWATGRACLRGADLASWRRAGAPPVVPDESELAGTTLARQFGRHPGETVRQRARAGARDLLARRAPAVLRLCRHLLGRPLEPAAAWTPSEHPYCDESMNDWHPAAWYRNAWPRMPAFAVPSFSDVHVRINLSGRERSGVVARHDYRRVCDEIERVVNGCRDGRDGRPLVVDVTRIRAHDPLDPNGPSADLVIRCRPSDALEHPELGVVGPVVIARTGSHSEIGFADIAGPGILRGHRPEARVCDLSAAIVDLVGSQSTGALDGRSILAPGAVLDRSTTR